MPLIPNPAANIIPAMDAPNTLLKSSFFGEGLDVISTSTIPRNIIVVVIYPKFGFIDVTVDVRKIAVWSAQGAVGDVNTAVVAPVIIKVITAINDRGDRRPKPHIPCPLVHPLPNRVPKPTNNPAIEYAIGDGIGILGLSLNTGSDTNDVIAILVTKNVVIKANFHKNVGSCIALRGFVNTDDIIPLAPKISPFNNNKVAVDKPINDPPTAPLTNVKESYMVCLVVCCLLLGCLVVFLFQFLFVVVVAVLFFVFLSV